MTSYIANSHLSLLTLDVFAGMNSLNWKSLSGTKAKTSRGAGTSTARDATCPKRVCEERPLSPVVMVSSGSSGHRSEQLHPRPACSSQASKSLLSSLESGDSRSLYLEALKTSLGDISQGEWNTFEGLADEDSIGAATHATMMVRHPLVCYIYLYLILCLIGNFYLLASHTVLIEEPQYKCHQDSKL